MANTTIYPFGTDGQLPSDIGIVNDLTTGGINKALSAEMGKVLGQRTEYPMEKVQPSESGTIKDTNGSDWAIGGYWRTPYVIIDPNKPVYAVGDSNNNSVAFVAFYNNKEQFISCVKKLGAAGVEYEIQVPEGATLARSSCTTEQKDTAYLTQKVQHKINEVVAGHDEDIEGVIDLLVDIPSHVGYLMDGVMTGSAFATSDYIRISEDMELVLEVSGKQYGYVGIDVLAFYSDRDDSTYLGGIQTTATGNFRYKDVLTIPSGAKWVRVSGDGLDKMSLTCKKIDALKLAANVQSFISPNKPARFLLPKYMDVVVGRQCDFFVADAIENPYLFPIFYSLSANLADYGDGHLRITASSTGTETIKLSTLRNGEAKKLLSNDNVIGTHTITVRKVAKSGGSGTYNVLIIGDSLVEYGSAANPVETYKLLAEDGDVAINQIGTQTRVVDGVTYRHEGHGGWTWAKFARDASSPFVFNGTLSFTQYMATNFPTLSGIDFCVIMLGTNDAPSVVEANSKEFIDQLISDYPNCKIAVGIPAYGRKCTNPLQKEKDIRVVSSIYLDKYDNGTYNANITCVGQGCWIDRLNDYPHEEIDSTPYSSDKIIRYTDSVHPSTQGYKQWGRAVYCKIRSWIAGNL